MQGKRILLTLISGIAAISMGTSASAFEMSVPNGWYIEGNVGSAHLSNSNFSGFSTSSSGLGGNVNLGYKFMPYVAAEIGYTQYSNTKVSDSNGTRIGSIKHYSYDIAGKGIVPICDSGFEFFAKLGAQHSQARISNESGSSVTISGSHSATGLYLGVGGQLNIMPELGLVAQWQRAQASSSSGTEDLYSIGLAFLFA
jgi:OOP family OmpA-OmpF porin